MLTIRLDSPVPLVEQIVSGLRNLIAGRRLTPGDDLPTVRQLAADLGVNLNTVARAYRALEDEGLVTSVRGRGTCVAAAVQTQRGTAQDIRKRVRTRLRDALADAKLAGLERPETEQMVARLLNEFWPQS